MKSNQTKIPCSVIRGGTSRGVYFLGSSLPSDESSRNQLLVSILGGPDALQVDGLGGGHPLTSKVAIVTASARADADVDYLFLQINPTSQSIDTVQNCGNLLSGVGTFAIENGLVDVRDETTVVAVYMVNSGNLCELTLETPNGAVEYEGNVRIDGVPGTGSPVICDFLDVAGSATGALLPTGNVVDMVNGIEVTCIDNGMPIVILRAADFGLSGDETPDRLESDKELRNRLEAIRLQLGPTMNLGEVRDKTVPKMCLVTAPSIDAAISTRTFIPHVCHRSIGVLGAVSVATACLLPDSVANQIAVVPNTNEMTLDIEHPSGRLSVRLVRGINRAPDNLVSRAGVVRTARTIMRGEAYVPGRIL